MKMQEQTELSWKVDELDRKLKASNDLVIFLLGVLSSERRDLSCALVEQLNELKNDFALTMKPELSGLIVRAVEALGENPFDLDSVDSDREQ